MSRPFLMRLAGLAVLAALLSASGQVAASLEHAAHARQRYRDMGLAANSSFLGTVLITLGNAAASLGRFDPALIAQARKRVAGAKEVWSAISGGDLARVDSLAEQFALVGDSLTRLYPGGAGLAQSLQDTAAQVVAGAAEPTAELAMEVATALLYLDASIEDADFDQADSGRRVQRLAERGFNQALLLAQHLAPLRTDARLLLRTRHTPAQSELKRAERLRNVQGVFAVEPLRADELRDRRVVLVDDVMTSGASLHAASLALRQAGAAHITALVFARTEVV